MNLFVNNILKKSARRKIITLTVLSLTVTHAVAADTVNYFKFEHNSGGSPAIEHSLGDIFIKGENYNGYNIITVAGFDLRFSHDYFLSGVTSKPLEHIKIDSNGQTITFRRTTNDECNRLTCSPGVFPPLTPVLQTQFLEVNDATLSFSGMDLLFGGTGEADKTNSTINLNNATLHSWSPGMNIAGSQHFFLNALRGNNVIDATVRLHGLSNNVTIASGASLKFTRDIFNFRNDTTFTVDGDLLIDSGAMTVNKPHSEDSFNINNGGSLQLTGHRTHGEPVSLVTTRIDFDHAKLLLGDRALLDTATLNLQDSQVHLNPHAKITATALHSNGDTTIDAPLGQLNLSHFRVFDGHLKIDTGPDLVAGNTAIIHGPAKLTLDNTTDFHSGGVRYAGANTFAAGQLRIDGGLQMRGAIKTPLGTTLTSSGYITPGTGTHKSAANVDLAEIDIVGPFIVNGGQLNMEVHPFRASTQGLILKSDIIGADNISGSGVNIKVDTVAAASHATASDYDGKEYTLVRSRGSLNLNPTIIPGSTLPALLEYQAYDSPSVSGKDITIAVTKAPFLALLKHPSIKPSHTLSTTTTTAVLPGTGQISTGIVTLLPAQTSGTTSTSTTTVHPLTGNSILTQVTVTPGPAGGASHQQTINTVVTTPTGTVVGQSTHTAQLKGPKSPGTAHKVVTTHVTSTTGALVSTNTSTIFQPKTTGTANHAAAANLLVQSANAGNKQSQTSLNTTTNTQLGPHVESIHAEPYSSYMTISLEHSDMVMNTVLSNAASSGHVSTGRGREIEEKKTRKRLWMDASYNDGDVDGDDDLGDFDYNLSSLTVGQDLLASDDRALGLYFSFGTQEMDEHDRVIEDFDGNVYHLGMYLNQGNLGGWDLRGVLGYAYGDHSSKRRVLLGNSSERPSADFDSHSAYVGVKGAVTGYQNDWVTLSPELGFNYIYYKQESFKESGDPNLSLALDSADAHAIIASAGLNARFASLSDSMSIYPLAFVRYEYDFYANANDEHEIDAALVAHPDYKQTFVGQNRGEHAVIAGLGLGSDISSALQVNGGFAHSEHSHGSEWGAKLNIEYFW